MWRKDVYFLHPDLLQRESRRFQAGPGIPDILEGPVLRVAHQKLTKLMQKLAIILVLRISVLTPLN